MRTCSFDGCWRKYHAKGLCRAHYCQKLRGTPLKPTQLHRRRRPPTERCGVDDCGGDGAKGGWCQKHWWLDQHYWKKFALDLSEAQEILRKQGGLCALCDHQISLTAQPGLKQCTARADHDHSGDGISVRGILCALCNTIEGYDLNGHWSLEKFASRLEAYRARGKLDTPSAQE